MMAKCKNVHRIMPTMIWQLLDTRETTLVVVEFIATTKADKRLLKSELEEEAKQKNKM